MKLFFLLGAFLAAGAAARAAEPAPKPLTPAEKKMAEAGQKFLRESERHKNKKPMPKRLQEKMNSSFAGPEEKKDQ